MILDFEVESTDAELMLRRLEERAERMQPALEEVADDFLDFERTVFATHGAVLGAPWPPLAESTKRYKARHYPGTSILEATGEGKASLTRKGAAGQVRTVTADSMTVGTSVRHMGFHQRGTRKMPRRQILGVPPRLARRWVGILEDHLFDRGRALTGGIL